MGTCDMAAQIHQCFIHEKLSRYSLLKDLEQIRHSVHLRVCKSKVHVTEGKTYLV